MDNIEVLVTGSYLDIFDNLISDNKFSSCTLNLYSLKISNKKFNYDLLINDLVDRLITFCTCSKKYKEDIKENKIGQLSKESRKLFREYNKNTNESKLKETRDGELGELMLYSFAESHLNAPKLLTKMRFKTSTKDPVKRSDGIHLLKVDDDCFEIVYGESKLYKDLTGGVSAAFSSINEFINRDNNNITDEYAFLIDNIESEFSDKEFELVKDIIIPNEKGIDIDNSFAIFVGFEININFDKDSLNGCEFRKRLQGNIKIEVTNKINYIQSKINEYELNDYNFYIYFVPFTNLNESKVMILEEILS
ncbi:MAG: HamA C-terminal domain-containing protein [Clostridium chrysemydis]|uniref:HamA C-terminal domain-containing protein n=1 Tax=Clostridium chrysemydis TaxID=2665504 RepID=UPI003F2E86BE